MRRNFHSCFWGLNLLITITIITVNHVLHGFAFNLQQRQLVEISRRFQQSGSRRYHGTINHLVGKKRSDMKPLQVFSGIVEQIGHVEKLKKSAKTRMWDGSEADGTELTLKGASKVLGDSAYIGCSIAVNGVCLTVTEFDKDSFTAGIAPETISKTNLGFLSKGNLVNLERSLPFGGRNSGHYVQGHVDNTGKHSFFDFFLKF